MTRLEAYALRRKWSYLALGCRLGVSSKAARSYCLPCDHAEHRRPGKGAADKLKAITNGEIHIGNYSDQLSSKEETALNLAPRRRGRPPKPNGARAMAARRLASSGGGR